MLSISVSKETNIINDKILRSKANFKKGILNGAKQAGRSVQKRITTMLATGTRSGIHYANLPNRSSAPGEFPRSQSGALLNSIYYNASINDIRIGSNVDHATYLTTGTHKPDGTLIMSARPHVDLPFFELAMELEERNIENYLRQGVLKEIC